MLTSIIPKLPMRDKANTIFFYIYMLDFQLVSDYGDYLILTKDNIEIHFFSFASLNPFENYGQVYIRVTDIENIYEELTLKNVSIHPNGALAKKPWGMQEFSLLDPDHNLLTFGELI
ncbi:MAG: VOC family protein [Saprospiraceae bacterium]|nr:VOC family protein [Saprospiraceae bacterium]